jgi:ketopantoate reductase
MRIAVMGTGGVGGYFGDRLRRAGQAGRDDTPQPGDLRHPVDLQ